MALSEWAADYVNLVLAVGRHDPDFVDAYYGPKVWKATAEAGTPRPLAELQIEAARILEGVTVSEAQADEALRRDYLLGQLGAVAAHLARLEGHRFSFDDEAEALYQVRPPQLPEATFEAALARLDRLLDWQRLRAGALPEGPRGHPGAHRARRCGLPGGHRRGPRAHPPVTRCCRPPTTSAWSTSPASPGPPTTGTRAGARP